MTVQSSRWGALGAALSAACAVHCVVVPIAIGALPTAGLGALLDHRVELAILATVALFVGVAAWSGWRTHKRSVVPLAFVGALATIGLGHLVGETALLGRALVIGGALGLAAAHIVNHRLLCLCRCHA